MNWSKTRALAPLLVALLVLVAGCGSPGDGTDTEPGVESPAGDVEESPGMTDGETTDGEMTDGETTEDGNMTDGETTDVEMTEEGTDDGLGNETSTDDGLGNETTTDDGFGNETTTAAT